MPQLTLTISKNIDANLIDFRDVFRQVHEALAIVPGLDINFAHTGLVQESFSYIGLDNPKATKVYLQLYWLENEARAALKSALGKSLVNVLENTISIAVKKQGLHCTPRVTISSLGELNKGYFVGMS